MNTPTYDIVDCHAHIFPPLEGACGLPDAATHRLFQQRAMHTHGNQPVRRMRDHALVREKHLWDAVDASEAGRRDVAFRVGRFGRFEWHVDGEDYYVQFLPPSLQDMHFSADALVAQMEYAGVQTAVLHNDHIYGDLSAYFAEATARYPDRFVGLANVEEAFAYRDDQIARLHQAVNDWSMSGLYYTLSGFFRNGYTDLFSAPLYYPFWDAVAALDLPVFWVFLGDSPAGGFREEMGLFRTWLERYGQVRSVLVHGVPTALYSDESDRVVLPDYLRDILDQYPVYSEVLYPIAWGGRTDYPYERARQHIRQLYDQMDSQRLIWGSDMPNVERYCTYRQARSYLDYCDFLSDDQRRSLLGGNARRLFAR